jgi:hypothetical protein
VNVELVLIGLFVGFLVGLTGVGGGSILTPLLVIVMGVNPLIAVGADLLHSVPTKLFGAYLHHRQRSVNPEIVKVLLWGGIPASLAGIALLLWLRHHVPPLPVELVTRRAIGATLLVSAAIMLVRPFLKRGAEKHKAPFVWTRAMRWRVAAIGALVGAIVTITSIGSGSITLPLLSLCLPLVGLEELIGTDIAFAAFLIPVAAAGQWSLGNVNLPIVFNLLAGSMPGVYVGSKVCGSLGQQWLRPAVAVTLVFVAARLM